MDIVEQLIDFHHRESWHKNGISDDVLRVYFKSVLSKGRILLCMDGERILGYCESWRINFEQLGRILCGAVFCADGENINDGNIAYVANAHILPEYQDGWVYKFLKDAFLKQNYACEYFVGEARRKKHQPFKCFKRRELIKNYLEEVK